MGRTPSGEMTSSTRSARSRRAGGSTRCGAGRATLGTPPPARYRRSSSWRELPDWASVTRGKRRTLRATPCRAWYLIGVVASGEGRLDFPGPKWTRASGTSSIPSMPARLGYLSSGNATVTWLGTPWASAAARRLAITQPASHQRWTPAPLTILPARPERDARQDQRGLIRTRWRVGAT